MQARAAAMVVILSCFQIGWTRDRVLLLVDNHSENPAAGTEVTPALAEELKGKGYDVVPAAETAAALTAAGVGADPSALTVNDADKLRAAAKAEAVVTVTVSFFLGSHPRSKGPKASPAFGLTARMLGGSRAWRNSLGWIADDAAPVGAFTSKRGAPKPTAQACERLLWSLPRGRPDPAAEIHVAVIEPGVAGPKASRWTAPVERKRDFGSVAHFPLRVR